MRARQFVGLALTALIVAGCDLQIEQDTTPFIDAMPEESQAAPDPAPSESSEPEPEPVTSPTATETSTEGATSAPRPRPRPVEPDPTQAPTADPVSEPARPTQAPTTPATSEPEPNEPPLANDDTVTTGQAEQILIDVLANDRDPDDDPLQITNSGSPANGTSDLSGQQILYRPDPDFSGTEKFRYAISDGEHVAFATVIVNVVNNAPVAVADRATVQANTSARINIGANDYDPDDDRFVARLVRGPEHGSGSIVNDTEFSYHYAVPSRSKCTPMSDSILYELVDEHGLVSDQAVTLSISINC